MVQNLLCLRYWIVIFSCPSSSKTSAPHPIFGCFPQQWTVFLRCFSCSLPTSLVPYLSCPQAIEPHILLALSFGRWKHQIGSVFSWDLQFHSWHLWDHCSANWYLWCCQRYSLHSFLLFLWDLLNYWKDANANLKWRANWLSFRLLFLLEMSSFLLFLAFLRVS